MIRQKKVLLFMLVSLFVVGFCAVLGARDQTCFGNFNQRKQFGWITGVRRENDKAFLAIELASFSYDDNSVLGYQIQDSHRQAEFLLSPNATITLEGDALTELILAGVIQRESLPPGWIGGQHTVSFVNLLDDMSKSAYDPIADLRADFQFDILNGVIIGAVQQNVP